MDSRFYGDVAQISAVTSLVLYVPEAYIPAAIPLRAGFGAKLAGNATPKASEQATFLSGGVGTPGSGTTGASTTIDFNGGNTYTPGTVIAITFKSILINSVFQDLTVEYEVQSGATATSIATGVRAAIVAANDNSAIGANSRYYTTNQSANSDTKAQISTGMQAKYDASTATPAPFVASSGVLTITAKQSTGTDGNFYEVTVEIKPKPPTIITPDSNGVVPLAGIRDWAYTAGFQFQTQSSFNPVNADQTLLPVTQILSGLTANVTFQVLQDANPRYQSLLSGNSPLSSAANRDLVLIGLNPTIQSFGLILTTPSIVENEFDTVIFYKVRAGSLQVGKQLRQNTPIPVNLVIDAIPGRNELGYISKRRIEFNS
jgi:hypothetical protein